MTHSVTISTWNGPCHRSALSHEVSHHNPVLWFEVVQLSAGWEVPPSPVSVADIKQRTNLHNNATYFHSHTWLSLVVALDLCQDLGVCETVLQMGSNSLFLVKQKTGVRTEAVHSP